MPALVGVSYCRFQMPEVPPLLKTWLGVLGLEICGWSFPTPCLCEHTALVVCISFDGDSVIQRALWVWSLTDYVGGLCFRKFCLHPALKAVCKKSENHLDRLRIGFRAPTSSRDPTDTQLYALMGQLYPKWKLFAQGGGCGMEVSRSISSQYTLQKICTLGRLESELTFGGTVHGLRMETKR